MGPPEGIVESGARSGRAVVADHLRGHVGGPCGRTPNLPLGGSAVHNDHRPVGLVQQRAGHAAEQGPSRAKAPRTDHDLVRAGLPRELDQHLRRRPLLHALVRLDTVEHVVDISQAVRPGPAGVAPQLAVVTARVDERARWHDDVRHHDVALGTHAPGGISERRARGVGAVVPDQSRAGHAPPHATMPATSRVETTPSGWLCCGSTTMTCETPWARINSQATSSRSSGAMVTSTSDAHAPAF